MKWCLNLMPIELLRYPSKAPMKKRLGCRQHLMHHLVFCFCFGGAFVTSLVRLSGFMMFRDVP